MSWDRVLTGGMKGEYAQLFCAAKGGVYSFSRALARSVAPHIRVNVLGPGWVETAYGSSLDPATKQRITATIPLGRWGTPEDIAYAAVYLASDAAAYVTGQMLLINGGGGILRAKREAWEPRRVVFVTGKLAEPALRRTLAGMDATFAWEVAVMKITVAALMTTPWIARFLEVPPGTDLVLIPGLCEGDPAVIAETAGGGIAVEKGPKDLRQIPEYFGDRKSTRLNSSHGYISYA